jgi:spore germination protein YaaH
MSRPPIDPLLRPRPSGPPPERDSQPAPRSHRSRRPIVLNNRRKISIAAVALAVLVPLVVLAATRSEERPALQAVIAIDGWAPYWALDDSAGEISRRAGSMREVSPFWFNVTGVTQIETDKNASEKLTQKFLKNTRNAAVVPSIVDKLPAGEMAAILADPSTRQRHIETIVSFARSGDYDGIDVNYEQFAFADGRDTWEATRPNWVSFVSELAEQLRSDGRTLTVSIPVVYDDGQTSESGYWVYDYGAIVDHVDHIRMMVYDYSVRDPGPIAPLDFVRRSIKGAIEATGRPEKLVLAVPVYGRNWPVSTTGVCPQPNASNDVSVPGKTTVTARSVDDLIERRNAQPVYDPVTAEWSFEYELEITDGTFTCMQQRKVHYVDTEGVRARMDIAIEAGLGGIAVWALGFDDDEVWDAILIDGTLPGSNTSG